ncbi:DUF2279 domain-containing protein [Aestuariivirga sp.]|uniref:DUF2279 domain-containing protein n=1 Tax=Aestuariivirga sp. TaxID=2650926 RepID=UPI003918D571
MERMATAALACMLAVVPPGAAVADELPVFAEIAPLATFEPLGHETVLTKTELRNLELVSPVRIEPASAVAGFVDRLEYNLEKLDVSGYADYDAALFFDHSRAIVWDIAAIYGLTTAFGLKNWEWGSSGFHFENEGWFGEDTKYGGMDKLGHAYTGYLLTEYFSQRIAHSADDPNGAIVTGAILGMGLQTYIEFFDGFSGGHGFSYEDLIADGLGVGFSFLRNTIPELGEKLDFRMEYIQSEYSDFAPATDYAGQKYVLALKLSGFEDLEETPLRFLELQAGYFTEGYTDEERDRGVDPRREPYVAIGLNLNELLGEAPEVRDTLPGLATSRALEYLQVPYTYVPTSSR